MEGNQATDDRRGDGGDMKVTFEMMENHEVAMEWISNRLKSNFPNSVFSVASKKVFWKRTKIIVKLISGEYDKKLIQGDIDDCCYVASRKHHRDGTITASKSLFGVFEI